MNKNISKYYDKKANIYNVTFSAGSIYEKVMDRIKENGSVLDIGCGNGKFSGYLKRMKNSNITGIEISEKMARNAKRKLNKVIVGNIEDENMHLPNSKFDQILLMDILEHTFNPELVLKKIIPVLKKNGEILVTLPNIANWKIRMGLMMGKFEYTESGILDDGHIRFFTYKSAVGLFDNVGLEFEFVDSVCTFPDFILKIQNRLPVLKLTDFLSRSFPHFFAHQFLFVLRRK